MDTYVARAKRTFDLVERTLSGMPHQLIGSFSGNKQRFGPKSDLDIVVCEKDVLAAVNLLKKALNTYAIEKTNYYMENPRPGLTFTIGSEYILLSNYTPVQIIGSCAS